MKKLFFLFALLASIAASATVTVTPLSTDFTNKKVTFQVVYANAANNRAWVWIDLCPVTSVTPSTFQTAVISAASATGNNVLYASTNTRGFFVTASPATVTATLDNASGKFNWCAYGSDAPPNVTATNGTYTFKGTPPFILTAANGTTTQTVAGKILPASALTMTPITLTDQTGYPGIFCIYTGSDLHIDATHLCQQRTSGAKNWEAYIKDSRDNKLYRITQFSDNTWWFADDLAIVDKSVSTCSDGKRYYDGANPPTCPYGWDLPTVGQGKARWSNGLTNDSYGGAIELGYYYGYGSFNCGVNGCYGVRDRKDLIWKGCSNTTGWNGTDWGWNCSTDCTSVQRVAARARCIR
jgi:hypothetical protein